MVSQHKARISLCSQCGHLDSIVSTFGYRTSKKPSVGSLISGFDRGRAARKRALCDGTAMWALEQKRRKQCRMTSTRPPTRAAERKRRESSKLIYYWRKTEIKCSATACEIYEADVLPTFVLCGFGFNIFNSRYSPRRGIAPLFRLLCTELNM